MQVACVVRPKHLRAPPLHRPGLVAGEARNQGSFHMHDNACKAPIQPAHYLLHTKPDRKANTNHRRQADT
jgi:hypothetical protein